MTATGPDQGSGFVERVRGLATAFQGSRVFLTAVELDLFSVLQDEERTSAEVASAIDASPRATDRLMNALVALGLLEKRGARFRNTPDGRRLLVRGRPEFMANLAHSNHLWDTWSGLTGVVRTGRPVPRGPIDSRGDDWLRSFIAAMHWRGGEAARAVLPLIDLEGVSRVLDVGGGSGVFSMAFVRQSAGVNAVVFDLPSVGPVARNYIRTAGLDGAIEVVEGDYTRDDLPGGFDLVFLSAIIHSNGPDENARLIAKAAKALSPGGRVVVVDWVMTPDRTAPAQGALFAINMLVGTDEGDTFTEAEVRAWMSEAGLARISRRDTPLGTTLMTGWR